jgi:hypothetical protein
MRLTSTVRNVVETRAGVVDGNLPIARQLKRVELEGGVVVNSKPEGIAGRRGIEGMYDIEDEPSGAQKIITYLGAHCF